MPSALTLFGLFLFAGAAMLAIKSSRRLRAYRQSQAWPKVAATITKSLLREGTDSDGTSHLPEFAFRYSVGGIEYTSSLHTEGLPFPATEDDARQMVKRLPVGSTVQVAVKPTDPSCGILDTGFPKAWNVVRRASFVAMLVGIAVTCAEIAIPK